MRVVWLDALRFWAFFLLMLFHAGMVFNHWPWYVKSAERSIFLTYCMAFVSQFRLPLLFLVSGAATQLYLQRHTPSALVIKRARVFIPVLILAFAALSPLQILAENYYAAMHPEIFGLRRVPLLFKPYPEGFISWHHLWFLAYLLVLTCIAAAIHAAARRPEANHPSTDQCDSRGKIILCLLVALCAILPVSGTGAADTRDIWGTLQAPVRYGAFFAAGYIIFATRIFAALNAVAFFFITAGIICSAVLFTEFWSRGILIQNPAAILLRNFNSVFWAFGLLAMASRFNLKAGAGLNKNILTLYVIHQPVLLGIAVFTADRFSQPLAGFFLTAASLLLTLALFSFGLNRLRVRKH